MARVYHAQLQIESKKLAVRFVNKVLDEMEIEARFIASTGKYTKLKLVDTIYNTGAIPRATRVVGAIGSTASYARVVEVGAKAHDIFPKRAARVYRFGKPEKPTLKFYWAKAGRVVYANQIPMAPGTIGVSHPGQKGKGFLRRPLITAALRHRMRLIIYDV